MFNIKLRKDGFRRARVVVGFFVDANLAATILAASLLDMDKMPSKENAEEAIRTGLQQRGREHFYFCHENYEEEDWVKYFAWARGVVEKHWPTWNFDEIEMRN